MPDVSRAAIRETAIRALTRHGALPWIAHSVADAIAVAESQGNRICGLYYLESYCQQLTSGRVDGAVEPLVTRPRTGAVQVDARFGFAQPAFARALPDALAALGDTGIVSLAVAHAHTCTSLGYFTDQIARAGAIGMGFTNASPIVAAPGGKRRVLGTNPIAFSVPDGAGGLAMRFDQSTTTVALGKITMAKAAGQSIPLGWALDAQGNPTTDPAAALAGSLVSAGGYKGWGFGLMAEVLAHAMTGSTPSRDVKPLKAPQGTPHDLGQFYILIDPTLAPDFAGAMTGLAQAVAMDPGTRLPGRDKTNRDPVTVEPQIWDLAQRLAGDAS